MGIQRSRVANCSLADTLESSVISWAIPVGKRRASGSRDRDFAISKSTRLRFHFDQPVMGSTTAAREDVQRISVDTINDWKRIKSNFSSAAFTALDEIIETGGSSIDKDALLPHIDQV